MCCFFLSFLLLVSTIKHSGVLLHTLHSKLHYTFQNNIVPGPNSQWKLVSKSPYRLMEYDRGLYIETIPLEEGQHNKIHCFTHNHMRVRYLNFFLLICDLNLYYPFLLVQGAHKPGLLCSAMPIASSTHIQYPIGAVAAMETERVGFTKLTCRLKK